jgi:branched-chain amino acid transport system ATP-binding protein
MMLKIEALCARYGSADALHGMSLEVTPGEVVAMLGRNGMGKSTTMRAVMRLREPTVTAGSVSMEGDDVLDLSSHQVARRGLGYVPQGRRVFGSLTVDENLLTTARPSKAGDGWDLKRVYQTFRRLADRKNQRAGGLSGGEQQMLAIGRALMTNPTIVLMDEPSEGLAPNIVSQVGQTIRALRDAGMGVLVAEQDIRFAVGLADRVYIVENGRTVASGSAVDIDNDLELKERYLGLAK